MEGVLERWKIFVGGLSALRGRTTQMASSWLDGTTVCSKIEKFVVNFIYTKSVKKSTQHFGVQGNGGDSLKEWSFVQGWG
jgi:hypothetical protein